MPASSPTALPEIPAPSTAGPGALPAAGGPPGGFGAGSTSTEPSGPAPSGPAPSGPAPSGPAGRLKRALLDRRRLLAVLCGLAVIVAGARGITSGATADSVEEALAAACVADGLRVDPATVTWLDEDGGPLTFRPALFLARRGGGLSDLYYADVRAAGDRTVLDVAFLSNLTHTASADEEQLTRIGDRLALAARVGDRVDAVVVVDPAGAPASITEGWSSGARLMRRISRLQETGRAAGFGIRRYQLREPIAGLSLAARGGRWVLAGAGAEPVVVIDPARESPFAGEERIEYQPQTAGEPSLVPWTVDTVRNVSWIGPEPIEYLENRAFSVKDTFNRAYHGVFGSPDTAEEVAADLAVPESVSEARIALLTVTDPELGWPPAPLEPLIQSPPVEGEGRWIPVVDDPFVNAYPNAPPAFFQTFVRSDEERPFTRVYVTLWDPRQVQMRIQSGVREPESATGQRGSGMIPREPEVLGRLVAAFNGGFQSLHGEFGMMASGRVYLPPKPWAATVAVFDDGRVGMGSWPAPNWRGRYYEERLANRQIPEDVVDLRQNLTSVVEAGEYNPWERWYWGAAPRNADDQTYTTRSGMCLTDEGFLAYFWSQGSGPEALGEAMIRTRCARSVHLDMNNPHCGFEFFRPFAPGQDPSPLARPPRADAEFDGRFPRTDRGWRLRARRAVRSMAMPFPRYSDRDARDFFYLTLRPTLPGPHIEAGEPGDAGVFSTAGLPHAGWPHAFARTHLGDAPGADPSTGGRTWIVRIDPRRAVPGPISRPDHTRSLALLTNAAALAAPGAPHALYARQTDVGYAFAVGAPAERDRIVVAGPALATQPDAGAALGVDRDGFLVYAEREGDPRSLNERLASAGVEAAVALPAGARLAFAVGSAFAGPNGLPRADVQLGAALALLAEERPATEVMFPDNEPQPYRVWGYLQDQRVRYFPNREDDGPRFVRPNPGE